MNASGCRDQGAEKGGIARPPLASVSAVAAVRKPRCRRLLNGFHLKSSSARTRKAGSSSSGGVGLSSAPPLGVAGSLGAAADHSRALPLRSLPSTTSGDALIASSSIMLCCNCLSCCANLPRNHQRRRTAFLRGQTPRLCRERGAEQALRYRPFVNATTVPWLALDGMSRCEVPWLEQPPRLRGRRPRYSAAFVFEHRGRKRP